MSFIFSPYPLVLYDPTGGSSPQLAVDITRRFKLQEATRNSKLVYYDYQIKDRDRPDHMAEKYYGNSRLDWLFFITNQIHDPYFQWPLNYSQFDGYIRKKYGSPSVAQATVHHYEQIITPRSEYFSNYDGSQIIIPEKTVIVDYDTYLSVNASLRKIVDVFEHEEQLNNKKRNIKILDKAFVPGLMRDFRRIFEV